MDASEAKRGKKGEGLVRERSPGKWEARITINGHKKSFYGSSEKEVAKKLKEFKLKLAGGVSQHKKVSYSDFMQTWLDRKKLQVKEQSYHRIESTYKVHIEPAIGYYNIDRIDAKLIQDELINGKIKSLSHSSVKKIYDVLNSSFKFARSTGYLVSNPVDIILKLFILCLVGYAAMCFSTVITYSSLNTLFTVNTTLISLGFNEEVCRKSIRLINSR